MAIQFTCTNPSCGRSIHAPDTAAGRKARCPKCGQVLRVPSAEEVFPLMEGQSLPAPKPSRAAAAPRVMIGVPPTLQKSMNMRPFIAGGIALVALAAVVVVVMMALRGNDKKATVNPPAASISPATGNPSPPAPGGPSSPPPNNSAGSSQTPGQVVATPGVGVTVIDVPAEYVSAVLSSRAIGQRGKSLESMRLVRDAIIAYTLETDKFPASWSELTSGGRLNPEATKSVGDPQKNFVLVSGQTQNSPKMNILAYDPYPYGGTSMVIIEVEGSPRFINIADLKKQLKAQGAKANEIPD